MKKLRFLSTLFLALFFAGSFFTACNKQELEDTKTKIISEPTIYSEHIPAPSIPKKLDYVDIDLPVRDGRLVFESISHLFEVMEQLSDSEESYYSQKALEEWEVRHGFKSMRRAYEEMLNEHSLVESKAQLQEFKQKNEGKLIFSDDDIPRPMVNGLCSYIIDESGIFYENDAIHHITNGGMQIIIGDGDEAKLADAIVTLESNPAEQITVSNMYSERSEGGEAAIRVDPCGAEQVKTCADHIDLDGKWIKEKKIWSEYSIIKLVGAASNLPPYQGTYFAYQGLLESKKRHKWWGWQKNNDDDFQFGTGYGIIAYPHTGFPNYLDCGTSTEACSGTSWITNNFWRTSFFTSYANQVYHIPTSSCNSVDARFLYNINYVKNLDVPGLECSDDCWNRGCN